MPRRRVRMYTPYIMGKEIDDSRDLMVRTNSVAPTINAKTTLLRVRAVAYSVVPGSSISSVCAVSEA